MELKSFESAEQDLFVASEAAEITTGLSELSPALSLEAGQLLSVVDAGNATVDSVDSAAELKSLTANNVLQASDSIISPISFIQGTPNSDLLIGTPRVDFIFGLESDDFILAQGSADKIYAGSGDDFSFGGDGNDEFRQWSGNRFVDGSGSDILFGGDGKDVADYRFFSQAITLEAGGAINKGKLGTDQIFDVEVVRGTLYKPNSINASTGTGNASIEVNLFSEELTVKNVPTLGDLEFTVENFVNVTGTNNDDQISGDNGNNRLSGLGGEDNIFGFGGQDKIDGGNGDDFIRGDGGNDTVQGGAGDDTVQGGWGDDYIVGVGGGSQPGSGEVDVLTGGFPWIFPGPLEVDKALSDSSASNFQDLSKIEALVESNVGGTQVDSLTREPLSLGAQDSLLFPTFLDRDTFALGNRRTPFYQDNSSFGLDSYGQITDFQSGFDKIELEGSAKNYLFVGSSLIFRNEGFAGLDPSDDLVGFVGGSGVNQSTDISYLG